MKNFWQYLAEALAIRPKRTMRVEPTPDPPVHIEPDPDMAPGKWEWECAEDGCDAKGTGENQLVRLESMTHCLHTGHSVKGNLFP